MKYLSLVLSGLNRNQVRSFLTLACITIAFLLYGLLTPVQQLFTEGPNISGADRLIVSPRHSITDMLPLSHYNKVLTINGVEAVAHQTWFGGTYQDNEVSFTQWAVSHDSFFDVFGEASLNSAQLDTFQRNRIGAIAGRRLADELGWREGDRISLIPNIWHNKDGRAWEFELVGIYDADDETVDTRRFFFRYDFFDEYRLFGEGTISNLLIRIEDAASSNQLIATVDGLFQNSSDETLTVTEREYILSFARQLGDISTIINAILIAVLFTILLVTANTMSQGFRDRIPELAAMKTLGFQDMAIFGLVVGESVMIFLIGAICGLGIAAIGLIFFSDFTAANQMGVVSLDAATFISGLVLAVVTGIAVGTQPALQAKRLRVIDALRSA